MSSGFKCKRPGCQFHHLINKDGSDGYCCRACICNEDHHTRNCSGCKHNEKCPRTQKNHQRGSKRSLQEETPNHAEKRQRMEEETPIKHAEKRHRREEETPNHNMKHAGKRQRRDSSSECSASTSEETMTGFEYLYQRIQDPKFFPTVIEGNPAWSDNSCEQAWMWPEQLREYGCLRDNWLRDLRLHHSINWGRRITIIATCLRYEQEVAFGDSEILNVQHKFSERADDIDHELVKQSGVCPEVMLNIWKHSDFHRCMAEAVSKIENQDLDRFAIYCVQGTHRSVGMACLLTLLCYRNAQVVITTKRTRGDAFSVGWEEVVCQ